METISQYEVRCPHCDVSFPVGTKKCMHCGGRTGPSMVRVPGAPPAGTGSHVLGQPFEILSNQRGGEASGPLEIEELEEAGSMRRSPMRAVMYAVWIAMAVAFSILRACTEQPG